MTTEDFRDKLNELVDEFYHSGLQDRINDLCEYADLEDVVECLYNVAVEEAKGPFAVNRHSTETKERIIRDGLDKILSDLQAYEECPSRWQDLQQLGATIPLLSEEEKERMAEVDKYNRIMKERRMAFAVVP
jgi:hypothetical protein